MSMVERIFINQSEHDRVTQNDATGFVKAKLSVKVCTVLQHKAALARGGDRAEQIAMRLQSVVVAHAIQGGFCA